MKITGATARDSTHFNRVLYIPEVCQKSLPLLLVLICLAITERRDIQSLIHTEDGEYTEEQKTEERNSHAEHSYQKKNLKRSGICVHLYFIRS